ncbi:glycosyltransferase family 2 protein [Microbaculum marinisediminis]|uniref:Glycosyltransferase family 2 protein n=1 Tax=Microbaculum marinisediminis TaxID=2931392 RepID=A0AAW5QVU8_9HYPH|nr:glycosyltransferase family 2 protein [Microbaculum sp. A6E488]MCT8972032.1 glycosyltransferase family 2 protein [Microbaculum sp. A6E488]
MKVSVVIPTKNPGRIFRDVLDRVLAQDCPWPYEVLVIDSGSSDGTQDYARAKPGVRLHEIAPEDFGHGRTRNLGASLTTSEYVAFLTHDALPVDNAWLRALVGALEQDPSIAGAFGRHVAYPDASPFTKRDLEVHFDRFSRQPPVVSRKTDPQRYETDQGWRQFLHFYSDNNSCLRRSVWETLPYPDVEFAEDQIWAHRMIEAGYAKAYAPDAVVYHSHDYGVFERFQRSFDESNAFRVLFGYRLNARPVRAFLSIGYLAKRDLAFAWRNRISPFATLKRLSLDVASVSGQMVGAHAPRLPGSLRLSLSRDKRLQRSLPVTTPRWSAEEH